MACVSIKMSKLIRMFQKLGYVNDSNDEIVAYGLKRIYELLIDIVCVIICGIVMKNVGAALIFEFTYVPLRVNAGGYHASNEKKCKYLSWISIVLSIAIIAYFPIRFYVMHLLIIISSGVIVFLAPVESINKPLTDTERKVFFHRSIIFILTEEFAYILFVFLKAQFSAKAICVSCVCVAIGLVLGILQQSKV